MKFKFDLDKSLQSRKSKLKEEEKTLNELKKNAEFEKGDFLALIIAALTTIFPVVLIILFLYYAISMFFFG